MDINIKHGVIRRSSPNFTKNFGLNYRFLELPNLYSRMTNNHQFPFFRLRLLVTVAKERSLKKFLFKNVNMKT